MKTKMAGMMERGTGRFLLKGILLLALGAAQTVQAEWWGVKGNASSPSYWDVKANWYISGNQWDNFETSTCNNFHINPIPSGANIFVAGWDSNITFKAASKLSSDLHFCAGTTSTPIVFIAENGDGSYGITSTKYLYVKSNANSPDACLEILSGTYVFNVVQIAASTGVPGTVRVNGGTLSAKTYFDVGKSGPGYLEIGSGGLVNHTSDKYMTIGNGGDGTVTIKAGGTYENIDGNGNAIMANSAVTGTLNIQGGAFTIKGTLSLNYNNKAIQSIVRVTDGGVLTAKQITLNNAGTNGGTITFDGGTLKAYSDNTSFLPANANLRVYAGASGMTVDADGHSITIGETIENASGEDGAVTFKGNGTITFTGTASWTGGTTVEAGTTLCIPAAVKNALVAHDIVVAIPASGVADGAIVFEVTGGGAFTQAEVEAMTLSGNAGSRYALVLADNGTKIATTDTFAGEYVWNGGASGASWKTAGNWTKNGVPGNWYDSTAAVFENSGDAATVDSAVTAAAVTFRADATITGSATLSAGEIVVSNGVSATISAPTTGLVEKTGEGALTLTSSRTDQTTITEGTLVMSGSGVVLDSTKLTLGTDPSKSVALRLTSGATLSSIGELYIINKDLPGGTAEIHKDCGDWTTGNFVMGEGRNATTRFYHRGGTLTMNRYVRLGFNSGSDSSDTYFEVSGGTVTNTASSGAGYMDVGSAGNLGCRSVLSVKTNGTYGAVGHILVGNNAAGTLDINGGTVFAADGSAILCYATGCQDGEDCAVNISNGGTLTTKSVYHGSGTANGTLAFDDGTLKASADGTLIPAHAKLSVTVGGGGGTIDANGKTVTIAEDISGTGGMCYKGGGTVTLSAAPTYAGKTTVEVGTTLVVPAAIAGANLEFTIPEGLASGLYKVAAITGSGTFANDILSTTTLPVAPEGAAVQFSMNDGKTEIWCAYSASASEHVWIGGASGSLNVDANWLPAEVPTSGTVIIVSASDAALTNPDGSYFGAATIVFPGNTAPVTISGAAISGVSAITNNSSNTIEFENAVEFADNVDVAQNTGAIKFTGGATGVQLARATDIHGTYNFTKTGDLIEHGETTVKGDGVYNLPNATFYKHNGDFHMETGGRAVVSAAKINSTEDARHLLGTFNGEFKVNGEFIVSGGSGANVVTHYLANSPGAASVLIAQKIRVNQAACFVPCGKTIMGSGGIIRGNGYIRVYNTGSHEFGSYADWTMYHDSLGNTETASFVIYKHSSSGLSTVTFDTTDYYDRRIGRTITCEAPIGAANATSAEKFGVTVKGIGKFVFANTSDGNIFSGGLTVTNSATVEVMANAWPGKGAVTLSGTSTLLMHTGGAARTGAITVNSGATLKVAESGTVMLGDNLTLNDGATLAFNFTDKKTAPVLDLTGKTVTLGNQKQIKVSISGERPRGETFVLTSGRQFAWTENGNSTTATVAKTDDCPKWVKGVGVNGDGNLYAEVIRKGLTIICK